MASVLDFLRRLFGFGRRPGTQAAETPSTRQPAPPGTFDQGPDSPSQLEAAKQVPSPPEASLAQALPVLSEAEPESTPNGIAAGETVQTSDDASVAVDAPSDDDAQEDDEDAYDPEEEVFLEDTEALAFALTEDRSEEERAIAAALGRERAEARTLGLAREHRVYLSEPAGPGSLAEALNALVAEGLVVATFVSDETDDPHLHYRPLSAPLESHVPPDS